MEIRQRIEEDTETWKRLGVPTPIQDFVLRFGSERPKGNNPEPLGTVKECFRNAALLAIGRNDLRYTEGYVWSGDLPIIIHHAWCEDAEGNIHDPTLRRASEFEFMGVQFKTELVTERAVKNGYWGLYAGPIVININFLRAEECRRATNE